MAFIKQYWIFDKDGAWVCSINDSMDHYILPEGHIVVEDVSIIHEESKDYNLVDGKIVVTTGTSIWHSPPTRDIVAMLKLREERDKLLVDVVDRIARIYTNQNQAVPKKITDYRQALLDLPDNVVPEMDDLGNELTNVTWPDVPTD